MTQIFYVYRHAQSSGHFSFGIQTTRFTGPIEEGCIVKVPKLWTPSSSFYNVDFRDQKPCKSAGTSLEGKLLSVATAYVNGHQVIGYSSQGSEFCCISDKKNQSPGPIPDVAHAVLDNIDEYAWSSETLSTVCESARERGVELAIFPGRQLYACRMPIHGCVNFFGSMRADRAVETSYFILGALSEEKGAKGAPEFCYDSNRVIPDSNSVFELLCYRPEPYARQVE